MIQENKSIGYSKKLLNTFRHSAELIQKFPLLSIPTNNENVRGFIILDYIIFFRILPDHILILTIWDCRRDQQQLTQILSE